jgi:CheY-like chemotaxis protein
LVDNNEGALPSQSSKRRILVVDNEKDITTTLQVGLEGGGFDVDAFNNPDLALKRFKPNNIKIIIATLPTNWHRRSDWFIIDLKPVH